MWINKEQSTASFSNHNILNKVDFAFVRPSHVFRVLGSFRNGMSLGFVRVFTSFADKKHLGVRQKAAEVAEVA